MKYNFFSDNLIFFIFYEFFSGSVFLEKISYNSRRNLLKCETKRKELEEGDEDSNHRRHVSEEYFFIHLLSPSVT